MYPHARREQRGKRLVDSEKESAGRLVQEVQTHFASYVRGGVQQTGPSARLGHTPPGFTGQAAPDWIGDRRWIGDIRRKEQMLVKVVTLEVTISGSWGTSARQNRREQPELVRKDAKLLFANV